MLGIMASGCAYLPLDPTYPPERLRYTLDRADAVAVISSGSDPDLYGSHRIWLPPPSLLAAEPGALTTAVSACSPDKEMFGPQDCAYILFTSGSTGKPKGVMVTHENISLVAEWSAKILDASSSFSSATSCSLSFDLCFLEILLPLSVGGTVHVIPDALALGQLTRPVSFIITTPTMANELLRAGQLPSLKVMVSCGEVLPSDTAARLLSSGRVETLLNAYGPTEATVCVTVEEVTAPVPDVIPIGREVPGSEILILDADGRELPVGELGEICIFGGQVADGYVNDPAKTAERFAIGPSGAANPQRYYRTGDLGYITADGVIYFAGRADRQVKINGHRIELGEIDAALRSHPGISDAATIVLDNSRMVAYIVTAITGADIDVGELRNHLSKTLPRYMLPAGFVAIAELPKTVSGKLDAAALPEWSPGRAEREIVPTGEIDELTASVIEIVAEITGFPGPIRPSDDFIDDLGGTSLGIVRVLVELERQCGRRIRINDALADTSVAGLASLLREETVPSPTDFAFNTDGDAPPVFMIHAFLGGMLGLRRVAELLPRSQPVYGLHVYPDTEQLDERFSISSLAEHAVKRIREVQPTGQITMIGQSAGGFIVFEMARIILGSGDPEPRILLMDSARQHSVLEYYWAESVQHPDKIIPNSTRILRNAVTRLFRPAGPRGSRSWAASQTENLMTLNDRHLTLIASAIRSYKSQPYNGSITVMRTWQGRVMAVGRRHLGWAAVTRGAVRMIDVPGSHLSMMEEPHVHTVAERLADWLRGH
jgi:amino acid adenylation domain-containing protein